MIAYQSYIGWVYYSYGTVPYIVDDGKFWAQFDHHQIVVGVDVGATICPDVDLIGEVPFVNQNMVNLRFRLLW